MRILLALILSCLSVSAGTNFTEFYCTVTGTNINSGHTTNAAPHFFVANSDWNSGGTFTPGVDPSLSNVVIGDWASVYDDGATTPVFIGRVTGTNATTITVSVTIKTGTAPATAATGKSIRIGGSWYGPYQTGGGSVIDNFPFSLVNALMTNSSHHVPRINLKADKVYSITNTIIQSNGPIVFSGFTNSTGDGGQPMLSGSAAGIGHALFTFTGANITFTDMMISSNGTSGAGIGLTVNGAECFIYRVIGSYIRSDFIDVAGPGVISECTVYKSGASQGAGQGMFDLRASGITAIRCVAYSNDLAVATSGFRLSANCMLANCIAAFNGREGCIVDTTGAAIISGCDFYSNASNGVHILTASALNVYIENSNFIDNGTWGIQSTASILRNGSIINCGFGSGTASNAAGSINIGAITGMDVIGSVNYATDVTPYQAPTTGDFSISLAAAINAGRGQFLQNGPGSYTGTVGYPDIGAAQTTNAAAGGAGGGTIILRR